MSKPQWSKDMCFKPQPVMPEGVSEFDRFLYGLGLSLEDALQSQRVREWVKKHHHSKFVPIAMLEACGIDHRFF